MNLYAILVSTMKDTQTVAVFKALADPTRLKLVRELASCPTGQKTCGELSNKVSLSQPAMSHHFAKLTGAGIVSETKTGTYKIYSLNSKLLSELGIDIKKL